MLRLPIIPNDPEAGYCLPDCILPSFYMEDFTVLGLRVGNLDTALHLLKKNGIRIFNHKGYGELSIEKSDRIPHIIQLLNENNISCVISDIAEHVYQG